MPPARAPRSSASPAATAARAATHDDGPAGGDDLVDAVARLEDAGRSVADAARSPLARRVPTVTFAVVATAEGWRVESVTGDPG